VLRVQRSSSATSLTVNTRSVVVSDMAIISGDYNIVPLGCQKTRGADLANMGQAYKRLGDAARVGELREEALRMTNPLYLLAYLARKRGRVIGHDELLKEIKNSNIIIRQGGILRLLLRMCSIDTGFSFLFLRGCDIIKSRDGVKRRDYKKAS